MLVDDHPMTRAGPAQLINKQPDLEVMCEAGDATEALHVLSKLKPDLLLTDITMPGHNGLEFIKDVRALHRLLPILVISMHDELIYAERVLRAGARGYVMKEVGGEKLLAAIRRLLSGQVYLSERMSALLLDSLTGYRPRGSSSPIEKLDRPGIRSVSNDRPGQKHARHCRAIASQSEDDRCASRSHQRKVGPQRRDSSCAACGKVG